MLLPFLCRIGNEVTVYLQSNLSVIQNLFIIRFAFLIGKVLTPKLSSFTKRRDPMKFTFLIGKVFTGDDGSGDCIVYKFPFLIGKVFTWWEL